MSSPYELLVGLALLRERKRQAELHDRQGPLEAWSALVAVIGSMRCVVRQDEVDEVVASLKITPVHGVSDWVLGIGYFRGKLLNVIDGRTFFQLPDTFDSDPGAARILVVRGHSEWFGLQVSELQGLRHVWSDSASLRPLSPGRTAWNGYADRCLQLENDCLPVLQLKRLIAAIEQRK